MQWSCRCFAKESVTKKIAFPIPKLILPLSSQSNNYPSFSRDWHSGRSTLEYGEFSSCCNPSRTCVSFSATRRQQRSRAGALVRVPYISGCEYADELHLLLKNEVMIRRLKANVVDQLPPLRWSVVYFTLLLVGIIFRFWMASDNRWNVERCNRRGQKFNSTLLAIPIVCIVCSWANSDSPVSYTLSPVSN